jgi:hypothetical protein
MQVSAQGAGQAQAAACEFWVTANRDGARANGYSGIYCNVSGNMDGTMYWIDADTGSVIKSVYKGPVYGKAGYSWYNSTYKGRPGHRKLQWCGQFYTWYGATGGCPVINGKV